MGEGSAGCFISQISFVQKQILVKCLGEIIENLTLLACFIQLNPTTHAKIPLAHRTLYQTIDYI